MPWLPSSSAADMPTRLPPTMRTGTSTSDIAARFYVPARRMSNARQLFQLVPDDAGVGPEALSVRLRRTPLGKPLRYLPGRDELIEGLPGPFCAAYSIDEVAIEVRVHLHVGHRQRHRVVAGNDGVDVG